MVNKFLFLLPKAKYQIKISSFIIQLKNFNYPVMSLGRVKIQQPYRFLSFLNLVTLKFRIFMLLLKKTLLLNLISIKLKANTFSSLIEVDRWTEKEFNEQDRL